jgi:hypothetical protein
LAQSRACSLPAARDLLLSGALFGFLESVAVALDLDDLGAMHEAVDERDRARGVREDFGPLGERLVRAEQIGLCAS